MQRITVTVDDDIVDLARRDVQVGRSSSISAWVNDAMRRKALARLRLELELDEARRSDPYTAEEIAWAADILGTDADQLAELLSTPLHPHVPDASA
jgi:hypothetical protein